MDSQTEHIYTATGTYEVELITFNDCGLDTFTASIFVEVNTTNIDPWLANNIRLYPNPVKDQLNIKLPQGGQPFSIQLFNLNGQEIYRWSTPYAEENVQLNLSQQTPGWIFAKIRWGNREMGGFLQIE